MKRGQIFIAYLIQSQTDFSRDTVDCWFPILQSLLISSLRTTKVSDCLLSILFELSPLSFLTLSFCPPITLKSSLFFCCPSPPYPFSPWCLSVHPLSLLGVLGAGWLQARGRVSGCHSGLLGAVMYCCYWSSLLVMIPACHQSWHSLQTSQGGWKLNRGSLPCLWPKETCVSGVCVFKHRSAFILGGEGTYGCENVKRLFFVL